MEAVLKSYEAVQCPYLTRSFVLRRHFLGGEAFVIESHWKFDSPKQGVSLLTTQNHFLGENGTVTALATSASPDVRRMSISPSGLFRAIVRELGKASPGSQFLEFWSADNEMKLCIDLTARKQHGPIYDDDRMGGFAFCKNENRFFYIAESYKPPSVSFFAEDCSNTSSEDNSKKGTGSIFQQSWGEQLSEKRHSVLVVGSAFNQVVEVLPESLFGTLCPAEFGVASRDGYDIVVGVAQDPEPFKLGIVYCFNRKTELYALSVKYKLDGSVESEELRREKISGVDGKCCWNVRLTPDHKKAIFLAADVGGPHAKVASMLLLDIDSKKVRVVVPVLAEPVWEEKFCGIVGPSPLPARCFLQDDKSTVCVFSSPYLNCGHLYSVPVDGVDAGKIRRLTPDFGQPAGKGSWTAQDVDPSSGLILASWSDCLTPPALYYAFYRNGRAALDWKLVNERGVPRPELLARSQIIRLYDIGSRERDPSVIGPNALLVLPGSEKLGSVPLIAFPHGGPHSWQQDEFSQEVAFFSACGFAVLMINYRGSLGSGEAFVEALLGRIGSLDVSDCHAAVNAALSSSALLDASKVCLFGGSHGGFLVLQLAGQFPDFYKAVVARNPVVNIPAMVPVTDIPDWTYAEIGLPYDPKVGAPSPDLYPRLLNASPVNHLDNIRCPVLLQIGDKDLRVPPSQGYSLYYMLKARGAEVELRHYDDNHPLAKPDVKPEMLVSSLLWMKKCLAL